MADEIRAIETAYQGCRFRSRLEARWAVFFDFLGVKWLYEPEGFELSSGRYLPDFWLPGVIDGVDRVFVEIKGVAPSSHEIQLAKELCDGFDRAFVYIFAGDCWNAKAAVAWQKYGPGRNAVDALSLLPSPIVWGICEDGTARLGCFENAHDRVSRAYEAARSARFEHGETPCP